IEMARALQVAVRQTGINKQIIRSVFQRHSLIRPPADDPAIIVTEFLSFVHRPQRVAMAGGIGTSFSALIGDSFPANRLKDLWDVIPHELIAGLFAPVAYLNRTHHFHRCRVELLRRGGSGVLKVWRPRSRRSRCSMQIPASIR